MLVQILLSANQSNHNLGNLRMGIPASIRDLLEREHAHYQVLPHHKTSTLTQAAAACDLALGQLVRAVILVDGKGLLMAVLPADHVIDFDTLCRQLHRDLELVPGNRLNTIFNDCEPGSYPPLAPAYNLDVVLDAALEATDLVTFEPGTHTSLVQMPYAQFRNLLGAKVLSVPFARPAATLSGDQQTLSEAVEQFTPARVKRDVDEFHELPALPATAAQILQLAADPRASARQLAQIVEQDPALAAQVLRYANSSLYGYAGKINNLQTAIARVLGFEYVMNLALGFSIGKALRVPKDGPFGMDAFWQHSVCCARLVEVLSQHLPRTQRPPRGTAYLAGLLQNLGRLVLGHTFEAEFFLLNRFAEANPEMSSCELERQVLGVSHDQIGAWLMEAWGLPRELVTAVRYHHDEGYWEQHAVYPQLVLIANRALALHGIGEVDSHGIPSFALQMLELDQQLVLDLTTQVTDNLTIFEDIARRLAA
jgi:HD-like signal output (HDOD) protein/prolyl-tRNA editing enzyme YbaK/EbsC (Cys-tRNA(Pro) deacylase)